MGGDLAESQGAMLERVLALALVVGGLLALAAWGLPQDADAPEEARPEAPRVVRALPLVDDARGDAREDGDDDERDDGDDDEDDDERADARKKGEEKKRGKGEGKRGRG